MWNSFTTHSEQLYSQNMGYDTQVQGHSYKHVQKFGNNYTAVISKGLIRVKKKKVKWSHYRPSVAQRVGRGIALFFHGRGTRRGWVVSSTSRPHFIPRKDPVPILQEAGWAPGPVWTGRKSRPHRDSIPDRPAHSQSLYRLSYRAHKGLIKGTKIIYDTCQKRVEKD